MLTGKLLRVKFHRHTVRPIWLDVHDPRWLAVAEDLIDLYRSARLRTRGEVENEVQEIIEANSAALVVQGLARLLDGRCEYETIADHPPEVIREAVFQAAANQRTAAPSGRFNRDEVLKQIGESMNLDPEKIDELLFADLKDEQRIQAFDDITPQQLLERYNVALAQAVLLKSTGVEIKIWGESPARYRQLFRAIRFRRLIATIRESANNSYIIRLDGPLSLFDATRKYGLQLALFLPSLLHCKAFELKADLRWGAARSEKVFELSAADGLRAHTADYGMFVPKEFELFAASFRSLADEWTLADDPQPLTLPDGIWVPDFALTHLPTGTDIYLELFGFWRRVDLQKHLTRLQRHLPGRFLVAVPEAFRADGEKDSVPAGVVQYRRTPSAEAIIKAATLLLKKS